MADNSSTSPPRSITRQMASYSPARPVFAITLLVLVVCTCYPAMGHGVLSAQIEHHVKVVVATTHVDLAIDLTFHGDHALVERRRMDADRDGRISKSELTTYLGQMTGLEKRVQLQAEGRELEVVQLYDPELSLLENDRAGSHPLTLRLFYFTRLPRGLRSGRVFELAERLWSRAPAFFSMETHGREGVRPAVISTGPPFREGGMSRIFRIRYTLKDEGK